MHGRSFQNFDAFAPAEDWEVLSGASIGESTQEGDADCLYPPNGVTIYPCDKSDCSSFDPELLLRILLIGYLHGVTSERKLAEELHMHLAWRWFRSSRMVARLVRPCPCGQRFRDRNRVPAPSWSRHAQRREWSRRVRRPDRIRKPCTEF